MAQPRTTIRAILLAGLLASLGTPGLAVDPQEIGHEWPAFLDASGPLPVTPLAVVVDPAAGTAEARYLVGQDPVGGLQLEVVERYALSEDGTTLSGNVTVTFVRDGRTEGSFELRRRFERDR